MSESKRRREYERQNPEQRLGNAPIEEAYHIKMTAVMKAIDGFFNGDKLGPDREIGIVLLVFPYGDKSGRANFMSNGADRHDLVVLMKELIARFEGQPEISGEA